jgi:hypothetical protein
VTKSSGICVFGSDSTLATASPPIQPDARVERRQERQPECGSRAKCPSSIKRTLETRRDLWCFDRYTSVSLP